MPTPTIVDAAADTAFAATAHALGLRQDDRWASGYVAYEWDNSRHLLQAYLPSLDGMRVLEFGCNVGASSVVLASLGAAVVGVDIDPRWISLAQLNAQRHGVAARVSLVRIAQTGGLPFAAHSFDAVTCNSVLEYIPDRRRAELCAELDRVLRRGGRLLVLGTSNRLAPREVHSGRWLVNYLPRRLERWLGRPGELQRGIRPGELRSAFAGYEDLVLADRALGYLDAQGRRGVSAAKQRVLSMLARLQWSGWSAGMLTPSLFLALRKPPGPVGRTSR